MHTHGKHHHVAKGRLTTVGSEDSLQSPTATVTLQFNLEGLTEELPLCMHLLYLWEMFFDVLLSLLKAHPCDLPALLYHRDLLLCNPNGWKEGSQLTNNISLLRKL